MSPLVTVHHFPGRESEISLCHCCSANSETLFKMKTMFYTHQAAMVLTHIPLQEQLMSACVHIVGYMLLA